jgi:alpha-mannosidase
MTDTQTAPATAQETATPLYYTFGNHMHWVDMEWLWGYDALPGSVRDMLHFCREAGVKGNINFDAVGYEKLAIEAPEVFAELRQAVQEGTIEIAGASYGQPYGLFHGGESNIRQLLYGARTVRRLFGVWPKTFWEEEFYFFPQLPQMLTSMGYEYASLFFQWTWHTPEVPRETLPAVWWEGLNGSRVLTATRNALNLHQWPEDFAGLLDSDVPKEMPAAGIQQWLELMPSPDWMCRSELLLPQLQALKDDPRFDIHPVTLPEYLEIAKPHAEARQYTLDDVFHGLSLGKNGDVFRALSAKAEFDIQAAEAISTLTGFLGRPYPTWDVYPTWELEEAWRNLLIGQHHDNDECEGLVGYVGKVYYQQALTMADSLMIKSLPHLAEGFTGEPDGMLAFNTLGWERDVVIPGLDITPMSMVIRKVPPYGYRVVPPDQIQVAPAHRVRHGFETVEVTRGDLSFVVNSETGEIVQIMSPEFPEGALPFEISLCEFSCTIDGEEEWFELDAFDLDESGQEDALYMSFTGPGGSVATVTVRFAAECDAIDIDLSFSNLPQLDPGFDGALSWRLGAGIEPCTLIHDHPYGVSEIEAKGTYVRKYPTGDWMTSPQVFETVENPFTALQCLDFDDGNRGLLYITGPNQSFLREEDGVRHILNLYDPWDEDYFANQLNTSIRVIPHGQLTHTKRWKLAQEFLRQAGFYPSGYTKGPKPFRFGPIWCDAPNVVMTALYRESAKAGEFVDDYAGAGIEHPVVVRLVEMDGKPGIATLTVAGEVAAARLARLRGERITDLTIRKGDAPPGMTSKEWSKIKVDIRPNEIATVYLDPVMARKQVRDLDASRSVWATVHREGDGKTERRGDG